MSKVYLTEGERREVMECLERMKSLPDKYRFKLFGGDREVELVWDGKTGAVCNTVLPFQYIEHIDEPRGKVEDNVDLFDTSGRQVAGWTNKLIWGDNKLILSSLKNGPMREEIEKNGGLKLIYIDPPFDVNADFSTTIKVGDEDEEVTKEASGLEELAYRDTWGKGADSFIAMLYERLQLMRDLLADDGSIYVHCDWRVNSYVRLAMDEVFGKNNFVNEIIWHYKSFHGQVKSYFPHKHDVVFFYEKMSGDRNFVLPRQKVDIKDLVDFKNWGKYIVNGNEIRGDFYPSDVRFKRNVDKWKRNNPNKEPTKDDILYVFQGQPVDDVWNIDYLDPKDTKEKVGYPTQKPEELLERIIKASSNEGDLIADFFCGSGTTLAVAEKLGRKWIGSDLGKFAVHTTRKRIIGVQRDLKEVGKSYRAFEVLNLGKYERYHYVGIGRNGDEIQEKRLVEKEKEYLELIRQAYRAEAVSGFETVHYKKNDRFVCVGPIDMPVSREYITRIVDEAVKNKMTKVDILSFEYEMGLFPLEMENARKKGIQIQPKYIPKDVFDKRAVEKNQVNFYEVAHVGAEAEYKNGEITVTLKDFACFYTNENLDEITEKLKDGKSKVALEAGEVVKITKTGDEAKRERITKNWHDWIDYWSVDFDFESKKEIIKILKEGDTMTDAGELNLEKEDITEEKWTGNYIFENQWQSFRTKKNKTIEFVASRRAEKPKKGHKVAVKVVDILGNDTIRIVGV